MTRKLTDWNIFVKKIYEQGKTKNSNYEFKQALADASKRKSEMKHFSHTASGFRQSKTVKKRRGRRRRSASASASLAGGRTHRRHSRHHRR
jgi:hypothetical protein